MLYNTFINSQVLYNYKTINSYIIGIEASKIAKQVQLTPKKNQPMARLRFIRLISRLVMLHPSIHYREQV